MMFGWGPGILICKAYLYQSISILFLQAAADKFIPRICTQGCVVKLQLISLSSVLYLGLRVTGYGHYLLL